MGYLLMEKGEYVPGVMYGSKNIPTDDVGMVIEALHRRAKEEMLSRSIDSIAVPERLLSALQKRRVKTIGEMINLPVHVITNIANVGIATCLEFIEICELQLGIKPETWCIAIKALNNKGRYQDGEEIKRPDSTKRRGRPSLYKARKS